MARIGNFGSLIIFETSDQKILNFTSFNKTVSANWGKHERVGKKPLSEFLNPELQQVTFSITLDATHGVRPRATMEAIEVAVEGGFVDYLAIGNARIGKNRWKITTMSQAYDIVMNGGQVQRATVSLSLEEYL